jgi:putative DNA primase/helicase
MNDAGFAADFASSIRPPQFSDDALALAFADRHVGQLLYVPAWSTWLRWDGCRWAKDDTLRVFDLVRELCRAQALVAEVEGGKAGKAIAKELTSASTIAAAERLARSDQRFARRSDDFDADPWALNTVAGVVDLRNGKLRQHRRDDLFTKATSVAPYGDCPRWLRFLNEITQGDTAMAAYLQRFVGYTLTGVIEEHAFLFLFGPGGNGKSVLLSTVAAVLGDYATTAMADVFTMGRSDQHPTHLASLRGARMVMVTETEAGRPWAESRIKALTGGDKISARVMRGDPFEFSPVFKLWIAGNHRPVLKNPDQAMRRRLQLAPLTFVPQEPDTHLPDALKAELPGILAWAVEGCLAWQMEGLAAPAAIREASDEYFREQDSVANWFAERCERIVGSITPFAALFSDWRKWTGERGEETGSAKEFSESLERLAAKKHTKKGRAFVGITLLPSAGGAW